jgi:invasion protein IalB
MKLPLHLLMPLVITAGSVGAQSMLPEGGKVIAQFGDWKVVCTSPPPGGKHEICAVIQRVVAVDQQKTWLSVNVEKFSDGKHFLRVLAPAGVLLPPGLGLKIDNVDIGHAPFVRCQASGCYAQLVVEGTLAEQLKIGKTAIFTIFQTDNVGAGIPLSLTGFNQALAALEALPIAVRHK